MKIFRITRQRHSRKLLANTEIFSSHAYGLDGGVAIYSNAVGNFNFEVCFDWQEVQSIVMARSSGSFADRLTSEEFGTFVKLLNKLTEKKQ